MARAPRHVLALAMQLARVHSTGAYGELGGMMMASLDENFTPISQPYPAA